MLFNSFPFILAFLPAVLAGFLLLGRIHARLAAGWLVLASFFFYGWWAPRYVLLLLGSAAVNFVLGMVLARTRSRAVLACGIAANLVLLGYYKYTDFFIASINHVAGTVWPLPSIILPIGISFYTFTQIAYLVDACRGLARDYDALHYLLFVSYFPHLVAGPLLHHAQVMPQFDDKRTYRLQWDNVNVGLVLFATGLFKKVVLADQFASCATPMFDAAAQGGAPGPAWAWTGVLAYTLQLYFDFSGYSDMALGISRLFNVRLPLNFFSPYKSRDIVEFWRRWHMTLSAFLRDYLYIPLGGNRRGRARRYVNLMITMVLGGLWHGASWTFVAWGALHGAYLVVNHGWRALRERLGVPAMPSVVAWAVTFACTMAAWVPFRAYDMPSTGRIFRAMLGLSSPTVTAAPTLWPAITRASYAPELSQGGWIAFGLAIALLAPNIYQFLERRDGIPAEQSRQAWAAPWLAFAAGCLLFFSLKAMAPGHPSPFLYFQF